MRKDEEPKAGLLMGLNTLRLNQATMQAALSAWLEREMASPLLVSNVTEIREGHSSVFEVRIQRQDTPTP